MDECTRKGRFKQQKFCSLGQDFTKGKHSFVLVCLCKCQQELSLALPPCQHGMKMEYISLATMDHFRFSQLKIHISNFTKTSSLCFGSHIHRKVGSLLIKAAWDGEFTMSLGSLFQWSVISTVKNSYFISSPTTTSFAFQSLDLFLSFSALLKSPLHSKFPPTSFSQTMIKSPL